MTTEPAVVLQLQAGRMAAGGACVARAGDGRVVFVRHALPGEKVLARITDEATAYMRAEAFAVLEASPDRVEPPCPYAGAGRCGGCDWQHVAVPAQRSLKAVLVGEQLRRLAGVDVAVEVEEVAGAADGLGWRTRMQFAVNGAGRPGLRKHRSHELELIDRCLIAAPAVDTVGAQRLIWPGAARVEVFSSSDGAERVVSVTSRRGRLHRFPIVDAGLVADGRPLRSPVRVRHRVLGRTFDVSAGVFWQVHPGAAEALAGIVLHGLETRSGDRVVDLYAGAGLFAALLGQAVGPAGSVLAVESNIRAFADAVRNTADQRHVHVRRATIDAALVAHRIGRPDLVVLDPPRAGAGRAVTASLAQLAPRRMAYVACDPASFARDLRLLLDAGWTLVSLRALDLFPMTEHVEVVAILARPVSDSSPADMPG